MAIPASLIDRAAAPVIRNFSGRPQHRREEAEVAIPGVLAWLNDPANYSDARRMLTDFLRTDQRLDLAAANNPARLDIAS